MSARPQHRNARLRSASYDADANTVEVVWTTGAAVRRYDPWTGEEFDEALSLAPGAVRLDRLNAGAPFLDAHDSFGCSKVVGSVVRNSARIENGKGICTIQLSRAPDVADIVLKIREGVIRNISVGYWVHRYETTDDADGVPLKVAVDWEPLEISAVPVPADAGSQIRSAGGKARGRTARVDRRTPEEVEFDEAEAFWAGLVGKPRPDRPPGPTERRLAFLRGLEREKAKTPAKGASGAPTKGTRDREAAERRQGAAEARRLLGMAGGARGGQRAMRG